MQLATVTKILSIVEVHPAPDHLDGPCLVWEGRARNQSGYGMVWVPELQRHTTVHKAMHLLLVGPVERGLSIDHLCHDAAVCRLGRACPHRRCVNTEHMKLRTPRENVERSVAARTACRRGHPYTLESTYIDPGGRRNCRVCRRKHGKT